jgi:type II secretory pathway component PulJ
MLSQWQQQGRRLHQAGLSIVELMVGIAIGLIIVAAATVMTANQLGDNRRLLLETQLQQDLRAAADIVARELRRSGALPELSTAAVPSSIATMWHLPPLALAPIARRNELALEMPTSSVTADSIDFDYAASTDPAAYIPGPFGFRKNGDELQTKVPSPAVAVANWPPLTDPNVMKVTKFEVTVAPAANAATIVMPCPHLCLPANDTLCWPKYQVREARFLIEGQATSDPTVKRAIRGTVRVRADVVDFNALTGPTPSYCPPAPP